MPSAGVRAAPYYSFCVNIVWLYVPQPIRDDWGCADVHMIFLPRIMFRRAARWSRRWICLGIRREEKSVWESRAPLSPAHVGILGAELGVPVVVQPSKTRVFSDREYLAVCGDPRDRQTDRHGFGQWRRRGPSWRRIFPAAVSLWG